MQRRRGVTAVIHPSKPTTDSRGNEQRAVDPDPANAITTKVAIMPQRSSRAEVPGQLAINVTRLMADPSLFNVIDLWGRVTILGAEWDIVSPPEFHQGTRQTRHISFDIRQRP